MHVRRTDLSGCNSINNYDIHGILRVKANVEIPDVFPPFFKVNEKLEPDLIVQMGDFIPGQGGLYEEYAFLFLRSKLWMKDLFGNAKVLFKTMRGVVTSRIIFLLRGILQLKLLQKGYCLIHGAFLSMGETGFLLVAPPETGKTFTTLLLLKHGFSFLSDDMTITDGEKGYCYPTPLTIHPYHIKKLGIRMGIKKNLQMRIKYLKIPFLSREFKLSPGYLGINIVEKAIISKVYFLEEGNEGISKLTREESLRRLLSAGRMHINLFENQQLLSYAYRTSSPLMDLLDIERNIYRKIVENAECYLLRCRNREYGRVILKSLKDFEA